MILKEWIGLIRRSPGFGRLFAGQGLYFVSAEIWSMGIAFVVMGLGGSAFWMGIVHACGYVPRIIFGPIAGGIVDKKSPKLVLITALCGQALLYCCLGMLGISGNLALPVVVGLLFIAGIFDIGQMVSSSSYIPAFIKKEDIIHANSLWEALFAVGVGIIASASGGFLIESLGLYKIPLMLAVALFTYVFLIRNLHSGSVPGPEPQKAGIKEGINWIKRNDPDSKTLFTAIIITTVAYIGLFTINTQFVFYCASVLKFPARYIGLIMATAGITQLIASIIFPYISKRYTLPQLLFASTLLGAAGLFMVSASTSLPWIIFGLSLSLGLAQKFLRIIRVSLCHQLAPQNLMGRIIGIYLTATQISFLIAALMAGKLASKFGHSFAFGFAGLICLSGGIIYVISQIFKKKTVTEEPASAPA